MNSQPSLNFDSTWIRDNAPVVLQKMVGREWSCDDLHGLLPSPVNDSLWGRLLGYLSKAGKIECVGFERSNRKSRNAGTLRLWRVKE